MKIALIFLVIYLITTIITLLWLIADGHLDVGAPPTDEDAQND